MGRKTQQSRLFQVANSGRARLAQRALLLTAFSASALACSAATGDGATFEEGASEDLGTTSEALMPVTPGARRVIQDLPASERKILADAILAFITPEILAEHANGHAWHQSNEGFFSFHHLFLNKLEAYLTANGLGRFVPLPMWKPNTQIPAEFLVLDPLVSGALNPNPNKAIPANLVNVCSQPFDTADALAAATNPWHGDVHIAVGGAMANISTSPGAPIFWLWHGFLDDLYHTYQACTTPRADVTADLAPADGSWGTWRKTVYCPPGEYAVSYKMRVEGSQGSGDDTSLNSVQLECKAPTGGPSWWVSSHNGFWGGWGATASCKNANSGAPTNFLDGARLRVEPSQGSGDDTGANDATFSCSQGDVINPGGGRGFGSWSNDAICPADSAVCGISVRTEDPQGSGDDTAMNGMRLKCCRVQQPVAACTSPFSESWTSTLGSASSGWTGDFGDPSVDTANRRLRVSYDDVVTKRGTFAGSYYMTHKLTLAGGTVFTPYPYVDGVLLPSIRRNANNMELGADRYGGDFWSTTPDGGFGGKLLSGLLTAKVTTYVQAQSKRLAMKVEAGGTTYRSGWTSAFTWPQTNSGIIRLVGENNSSVYSATDDAVYVGRVSGCSNLTDANVDAMYRQ